MTMPLAIDLFCGLGGWTEGLLAEGYCVLGFDIERHEYGGDRYPAQLVLQDVLTIHGRQFKGASLIVASPPCQEYSYMALPWSRAKKLAADYRAGVRDVKQLTELFDACFRIQCEASIAAGRHVPLIVENVRGAQPWVGRSRWNFGSFHFWGDVPALMPIAFDFNKRSSPGFNVEAARRVRQQLSGVKEGGRWFSKYDNRTARGEPARISRPTHTALIRQHSSSPARKAASALIAKIPLVVARHIARCWKPMEAA